MTEELITAVTIFALAMFVGYFVITKIPATLHTPLMSGTNAVSGIIILGAIVLTGTDAGGTATTVLAVVAVALATINVFGGFLVTDRMLRMFRRRGERQ